MASRRIDLLAAVWLLCAGQLACNREEGSAGHTLSSPSSREDAPLPVLHPVPEFSLTNEDGKPFGSKNLQGKAYLAAFMFTRCPSICPDLTKRMKEVDQAVKKANQKLELVSISVDPENDTPEVLRAYAKKHGADVDNWSFLTGDFATIARTSEDGFKIALAGKVEEGKPHLGITHGSHLILVDGRGKIRGYFRSSENETPSAIVRALQQL